MSEHQRNERTFSPAKADRLDEPARQQWLPPADVVVQLHRPGRTFVITRSHPRDNRDVDQLESLCRRLSDDPRIQAIYLFGSAAAGTARENSDLDLAVLIGERITLGDELRLRAIAVQELHRDDIDFVILDHAPPLLRYEVVTRGRRLFARDPASVDMFEHRSIMTYMDTEYLRRMEHEILREATR